MRSMAGTAFGLQVGHAVGELAGQAVAATDVGLPLKREPGTALVPANVTAFAEGLEADAEQVRMFLAVREAAASRLYAHVPWLRSQLLAAVETYAREIRIDTGAIEEAVSQVDPSDPEAIRSALESGMFAPQETPAQVESLEKLETLLALVEGWVEVVTAQATAPHLPHAIPLREMVRRRRIQGGPAEKVFARLIGLEFRPRRVREAAHLWELLGGEVGDGERDAFWQHPDVMPTASELAAPEDFLTMRRAAQDMEAEVDADLASLLDGTLGYADGVRDADENRSEGSGDD
jgi:putative hydrolase